MKKTLSILISILVIAVIFTGCYLSVGLFPRLGETTWEYRVYDSTTTYASGTFTIDKRTNFEDFKGIFTQATPTDATYTYVATIDKAGNIAIGTITIGASEAIKFSGKLNSAENGITGQQSHTDDKHAEPITWLQGDWIATKTSK
jgi:putative exporter of polyketide antibiotics